MSDVIGPEQTQPERKILKCDDSPFLIWKAFPKTSVSALAGWIRSLIKLAYVHTILSSYLLLSHRRSERSHPHWPQEPKLSNLKIFGSKQTTGGSKDPPTYSLS